MDATPVTALLATASGLQGPWGGEGNRLESSDGRSLELAALLDGFGVLCDALLLRVPAGLRVDPDASLLVLRAASLEPEALQLSYARWFEGEEAAPPEGMDPAERVLAMGRAFGARLLWHHGSFLPFEAGWTEDGRPRLSHGEPRGDDSGAMRAPCARAWRPEQGDGGAGGWRSPGDWKAFSDGVPGSARERPQWACSKRWG